MGEEHGGGHVGVFSHIRMWWWGLVKASANELEFFKIEERPGNMEDDKYDNHRNMLLLLNVAATIKLRRSTNHATFCSPQLMEQFVKRNAGRLALLFYLHLLITHAHFRNASSFQFCEVLRECHYRMEFG